MDESVRVLSHAVPAPTPFRCRHKPQGATCGGQEATVRRTTTGHHECQSLSFAFCGHTAPLTCLRSDTDLPDLLHLTTTAAPTTGHQSIMATAPLEVTVKDGMARIPTETTAATPGRLLVDTAGTHLSLPRKPLWHSERLTSWPSCWKGVR